MPDINLTVTVPDAYSTRVLNDFITAKEKRIRIEVESDTNRGEKEFVIQNIDGETPVNFGQRVLRLLGKNLCVAVEELEANEKYRTDIGTVVRDTVSVPDNVIQ